MTTYPVSVLVVDDQAPFRAAARAVVGRMEGFALVGEAGGGRQAVDMAAQLHPDMVLMDINMPEMNGIEATRLILAEHPQSLVVLCSTYDRADLPPDAAASGARAYVHKEQLAPDALRRLWMERESLAFFPG